MRRNKTLEEMLADDTTLLSGLVVPAAMSVDSVISTIVTNSGTLCPFLQDPAQLKAQIGVWSSYRLPDWQRMLAALTAEYNPIHNYYREELGSEEIAKHKGTHRSTAYKETETPGVTVTNTGSVVPYDANAERETGQSVQTPTGTNTRQGLPAENYVEERDIDANTYDKDVHSFADRVTQGNIGVTRTQEMIADELELRAKNSMLEIICASFEDKFLIQAY